ncbi:RNA polymerase sigma-70 factor, ECF subfamily [Arachidicoccus rhizosphaerae]|uniref:RNA polymerase sigma-70 factor, ECF subfamily n=1 Tax=Arachidicoccus rhizosphaerae TaxID=551991 RepID=A0A1H3XNW8_9BACT|nr:sigma-70 family RNA polymerase sigma factor [Arachidicoccus rhizosphaerae]SEA00950.1 RNA polymerase sigma-70 factor, ECF subfamily [Arachidicoccus rhizosphaerae]
MSVFETYSDEHLLELLMEGQEEALTEIYQRYWQQLIEIGYRFTNDKQAVEEIVNDVFLKLWSNPEKFQVRSLPAYLFTSIKFGIYKMVLKKKRRKDLLANYECKLLTEEEQQRIEIKFMEEYLKEVVESLPEKSRLIYNYSRNEEMSVADISSKMNMKTKAIEYHITKTLKLLRTALDHAHHVKLLLITIMIIRSLF